jgi:hypothetical protein
MVEQCGASGQFGAEQQLITTRLELDLTKLRGVANNQGSLQSIFKDP